LPSPVIDIAVVAEPNARRLEKLAPNGDYLGAWTFPVSDTFNAPHMAALPDGVAVTDPNGNVVDRYAYDAWGAPIAS